MFVPAVDGGGTVLRRVVLGYGPPYAIVLRRSDAIFLRSYAVLRFSYEIVTTTLYPMLSSYDSPLL